MSNQEPQTKPDGGASVSTVMFDGAHIKEREVAMQDRELLELAAKAAGYRIEFDFAQQCVIPYEGKNPWGLYGRLWNPLIDNGDAFHLAVHLRMDVLTQEGRLDDGTPCVGVVFPFANDYDCESYGIHNGDRCEATRRAIVKAAARIGQEKVTPNAKSEPTARLFAQVGSTDGLGGKGDGDEQHD